MYNFNTTSIWRRTGILFVFSTSCYEAANCCLIFIFTTFILPGRPRTTLYMLKIKTAIFAAKNIQVP